MIKRCERLLNKLALPSHVTVSSCLAIDRLAELEGAFNCSWAEVEEFLYLLCNLSIRVLSTEQKELTTEN